MSLRLKFGLGVMAVGAIGYGMDQINLRTNYEQVQGKIVSAEVDCYVKSGRSKVVDKTNNSIAYMPCDLAPYAAQKFGYSDSAIKYRAQISYDFVSPVDGKHHKGKYTDDTAAKGEYQIGKAVMVYANKEDANYSRIH